VRRFCFHISQFVANLSGLQSLGCIKANHPASCTRFTTWRLHHDIQEIRKGAGPYPDYAGRGRLVCVCSLSRDIGTVLAPCSNVKLAGGSSTENVNMLENQIIADTITLTGSNTLNINFNASQQWQPPSPAGIQIDQ
jgi:hypothetical protein